MIGLGFTIILACPFLLSGGVVANLSGRARRILAAVCGAIAMIAAALWTLGMDTLALAFLALVPAYQLELCTYLMNRFQRNHGREMHLIAFGIADPGLKKDAAYSTAYFAGAVGVPLVLFVLLVS